MCNFEEVSSICIGFGNCLHLELERCCGLLVQLVNFSSVPYRTAKQLTPEVGPAHCLVSKCNEVLDETDDQKVLCPNHGFLIRRNHFSTHKTQVNFGKLWTSIKYGL